MERENRHDKPKYQQQTARDRPTGRHSLLWALRDHLGLTGTKFGCGMALCGACTVHLDGQPIRSCITPISAAAGNRAATSVWRQSGKLQLKRSAENSGGIRVIELKGSPPPALFNPLGGIAVIARNTWAAIKGREALKITWDNGPHASYDSATYKTTLSDDDPSKVCRDHA